MSDSSEEDLIVQIMREFAQVSAFVRGRWSQYADELHEGLRVQGVMVLQAIWKAECVSATELSNLLRMDKALVSRQVAKLRALEMVCAKQDDNDKRITWLSVTEKGKKVLTTLHKGVAEAYKERLLEWNREDLESLKEKLAKFNSVHI